MVLLLFLPVQTGERMAAARPDLAERRGGLLSFASPRPAVALGRRRLGDVSAPCLRASVVNQERKANIGVQETLASSRPCCATLVRHAGAPILRGVSPRRGEQSSTPRTECWTFGGMAVRS